MLAKRKTLLAVIGIAAASASGQTRAAVDCGRQPELVPSNSTESFKADAAGKAQLFTKILPQADIKGNVETWRSEQHQNYSNIDQQQKDLYFQWISCQNIMSSPSMSPDEKQKQWLAVLAAFRAPIIYRTCALPEFGQIGWQRNVTVNQSSGWVGPGSNPDNWCNELINRTIQGRDIGPEHDAKVISKGEEGRWGNAMLHTNRQYNYHCQVIISWDPIYQSKSSPACGIETSR